jgi:hypothetical protein
MDLLHVVETKRAFVYGPLTTLITPRTIFHVYFSDDSLRGAASMTDHVKYELICMDNPITQDDDPDYPPWGP